MRPDYGLTFDSSAHASAASAPDDYSFREKSNGAASEIPL